MHLHESFDLALKQLKESDNAKRLTVNLLKASVEQWKEESIGKTQTEIERYHGAILHTRSTIDLLEQNFKNFELQPQVYN